MDNSKTVGEAIERVDPIYAKQKEDVAKMRTSLLACGDNPLLAKTAINQITLLRIYHQLSRIIRYTELMDKIETKLYESIERSIEHMDSNRPGTWMQLIELQTQLQRSMIESHKLLQPYLDLHDQRISDLLTVTDDTPDQSDMILDANSRDRIRNSAQAVLLQLNVRSGT